VLVICTSALSPLLDCEFSAVAAEACSRDAWVERLELTEAAPLPE
jgi:hypothetical protein